MDLEDKVKISGVTTTLIYLYVVPAQVGGRWQAQGPGGALTLDLKQQVTRVTGSARSGGRDIALQDVKLRGERLSFRLEGKTYRGRVSGAAIEGEVAGGAWNAKRVR
jgi:hypothetical protein